VRFLVDESAPLRIARALRQLGHDCAAIAEGHGGEPDEDVMALARAEERVLITFDADFARMIFHEGRPPPPGVVYMRGRPEQALMVSELFVELFREGGLDPLSRMIVIEPGGIVRSMPLEHDNG